MFFSKSRPNNIGLKFKHVLNTNPWLGIFFGLIQGYIVLIQKLYN